MSLQTTKITSTKRKFRNLLKLYFVKF